MRKYDLVIFDMDGVLINSEGHYLKEIMVFLNDCYPNHGLKIEDLYVLIGKSWDEHYRIFATLIDVDLCPKKLNDEFDAYQRHVIRDYKTWMFKDVEGLLRLLKKDNYRIALASNSSQAMIDRILAESEFENYFEYTASGDQFLQGKPSPEIYLHIAHVFGVPSERILVIEDSESGIEAGVNAGCTVIALHDIFYSMNQSAAHGIIKDLTQVDFILNESDLF